MWIGLKLTNDHFLDRRKLIHENHIELDLSHKNLWMNPIQLHKKFLSLSFLNIHVLVGKPAMESQILVLLLKNYKQSKLGLNIIQNVIEYTKKMR